VDQALAQLEKALQMLKVKSDLRGLGNFIENHVRTDEDLAPIRDDPGFEAVIERVLGGSEIDEGL